MPASRKTMQIRLRPCVAALMLASSCASPSPWAATSDNPGEAAAVNAHYSYASEAEEEGAAEKSDESHESTPVEVKDSVIVPLSGEERPAAEDGLLWSTDAPQSAREQSSINAVATETAIADETTVAAETTVPGNAAGPEVWATGARPASQEATSAEPVSIAGHHPDVAAGCRTEFLPADPRVTLPLGESFAPSCPSPYGQPATVPVAAYEPEVYPEEYICDGGDRGLRVYYDDSGRHGLETEDTVAEFTDHTGLRCIRPSTRTCIYAPQFASVRTMSHPQVNLTIDKVAGTHVDRSSVGLRSHLTPDVELHNDQPIGLDRRSRASGLERKEVNGAIARVETASRHVKLNNVFENELFLSGIQLDRAQEAYLAHAVQLAAAWTRNLNPVIIAADVGGQEVTATFHVEEYVGIEEPKKGELKIIKVVDEPAAVPGDVVTFTIHYENVGERELYKIRILDNLTPRLELLPESMQSDREGHFSTEDNREGSVVLTFELADPLPAKTGGTLTFQCRVH